MMNRGHDRQARLLQIKNAICQGLVVVYDIKVLGMGQYPITCALTKSPGLNEATAEFAHPLSSIQRVAQFISSHAP